MDMKLPKSSFDLNFQDTSRNGQMFQHTSGDTAECRHARGSSLISSHQLMLSWNKTPHHPPMVALMFYSEPNVFKP